MKKSIKRSKHVVIKPVTLVALGLGLTLAGLVVAKQFMSPKVPQVAEIAPTTAPIACSYQFSIARPSPSPVPPSPTPSPVPPSIPPSAPPSPVASSAACFNCQYQLDLFYGPVINAFTGTDTYSNTKRLIVSKFDVTTLPVCKLSVNSPQVSPVLPTLTSTCADPVTNKFLTGTIDSTTRFLPQGYVSGTITNNTTSCTYEVGIASYKAKDSNSGANLALQNLYDYKTVNLAPGATTKLVIKAPMENDAASCHNLP